jgi:hypothetical protein
MTILLTVLGTDTSANSYSQQSHCVFYTENENVTTVGHDWALSPLMPYLYLENNGSLESPPVGMRSAVPLGT